MIHAPQPPTGARRRPSRRAPVRLLALCAAAGLIPAAAWFVWVPSPSAREPLVERPSPPLARIAESGDAAPAFGAAASHPDTLSPEPAAPRSALEDFRHRAAADPAAAARWLAGQPTLSLSLPWLEQLALAWTERDPDAALRWVRERSDPAASPPTGLRSALLLTVAGELVRTRPIDALRAALDAAPSPARDEVLRRAAADWATRDALAATAWTWEIGDSVLRTELLTSVIVAVADADPATALIMAEDDLGPGRARDDVVVSIFQRWAQNDPDQARARWALLPDGQVKNAAARSLGPTR